MTKQETKKFILNCKKNADRLEKHCEGESLGYIKSVIHKISPQELIGIYIGLAVGVIDPSTKKIIN